MSEMPLTCLLRHIYDLPTTHFNIYQLWGSFNPGLFFNRTDRAGTATRYAKMTDTAKLCTKVFEEFADVEDIVDLAGYVAAVVEDDDADAPIKFSERTNALGCSVTAGFEALYAPVEEDGGKELSTTREIVRLLMSAEEAPDARGAKGGLEFLWKPSFKEEFTESLQFAFADAAENDFEMFWEEYRYLQQLLFMPAEDSLDNLGAARRKDAIARDVKLHVTLLALAALKGPASYYDALGLQAPSRNATVAYRNEFNPSRIELATNARLQPVNMIGSGCNDYYTDVRSRSFELDTKLAYVTGRFPSPAEGEVGIEVRSELTNVSRRHASLSYDAKAGWQVRDLGTDGEGSAWGTLVLHTSGSRTHLKGESCTLRHGDIICLGPQNLQGATPYTDVKNLSYRFEETKPKA